MKKICLTLGSKIISCLLLFAAMSAQYLQAATSSFSNSKGEWTVTTTGNEIDITFKPDKDSVNCPHIGLVQSVKAVFYDAAGDPHIFLPSEIKSGWAFKDPDQLPGGTRVDHLFCEKDKYYNGDDIPQDHAVGKPNEQGASAGNGTASTPAHMWDAPNLRYSSYPPGMVKLVDFFEVCAVCMDGPNAGQHYGCIKWRMTKDSSNAGVASLDTAAVLGESPEHEAAVTLFDANHTSAGVPICPEEIPAGACGDGVLTISGAFLFHLNDTYIVKACGDGVKKGSARPDSLPPNLLVNPGDTLVLCNYVFVPAGQKIDLVRVTPPTPITIPSIPFPGDFWDLYLGMGIGIETGQCFGNTQNGVIVRTCSNVILAALGTFPSSNPDKVVLFDANVDPVTQLVTFRNDPLSTVPLQCQDIFHGTPIMQILPGDSVVYQFQGLINNCRTSAIPTLGEWGLIIFFGLLVITGLVYLNKRS